MDADHPVEPDVASLFAPVAVEETFGGVLTEARQVLGGLDDPVDAELWGSDLIGALASSAAGLPACIGPLGWIPSLVVDDEELAEEVPQDAPMTLAAAEISPDTGRDTPQRTPLAWLRPLSETGASCACANAGAATPIVRMAAEAAPPSRIRQLNTKHSISMW